MFQEAATSTQSVSPDESSSGDEKMMITLQTEADQSDLAIVDTLKPQTQSLEHSCLHTSSGDEKIMITLQTEADQSDLAIVDTLEPQTQSLEHSCLHTST